MNYRISNHERHITQRLNFFTLFPAGDFRELSDGCHRSFPVTQ
ncbi:hypothetical protein [Azotobacter chroococcum]|nr:hypothetical protein [Azotobacter chroococcum]